VAEREDVDSVYVIAGPLFERETSSLPEADEPHVIPSGYFKIVMLAEKLQPSYVAPFILDQETPRDADYCDHQVSVEEIEERSGLDFFPDLESNPEASSELAGFLGCES
jgi:endonuclease G